MSHRSHHSHSQKSLGIVQPPVIFPVFSGRGPGRQVLHTTLYEHLDLLTPTQKKLSQEPNFPLLFESSSFAYTSPIIHDVNGDGNMDAIIADYDGAIFMVGLGFTNSFFHKAQVPRLYLRRDWMIHRLNETIPKAEDANETATDEDTIHDPYHSHFEYMASTKDEKLQQGVTAHVLNLGQDNVEGLEERRKRRITPDDHLTDDNMQQHDMQQHHHPDADVHLGQESEEIQEETHRRLQQEEEEVNQEAVQQEEEQQPQDAQQQQQEVQAQEEAQPQEEEHQDEQQPQQEAQPQEEEERPQQQQEELQPQKEERPEKEPEQVEQPDDVEQKQEPEQQDEPVEKHDEPEVDTQEQRREESEEEGEPPHDDPYADRYREFDDDYAGRWDSADDRDDDYPIDDHPHNDDYYDEYGGYDDYYYGQRNTAHDEYYDDKHYVRIPPHILCSPVLAEMPKLYGQQDGEMDEMLFVAVSYYLDEDEYEGFFSYKRFDNEDRGDETEVQRGMYVANALMVYNIGEYFRWGRQEHLDLSGDATASQNATLVGAYPIINHESKMGAFALGSPTVADIDGDGSFEVLMGTSMGLVYGFDARNFFTKEGWPVQMIHAVESRILVEDVVGDTNLEIFIADIGSNVVCLDKQANTLWHRNLAASIDHDAEVLGSSQMSLGDIDGDGRLDLVGMVLVETPKTESYFIVAISAVDGKDLPNFPIAVESKSPMDESDKELHHKLPQPLLVDLHADQSQWKSFLYKNSSSTKATTKKDLPPHGGSAKGMHVVQPIGSDVFIIEAGSGCIQTVAVGEEVTAMVQADDVHGTNRLDLVISTTSGNVVTLESPAVQYHPLNVWNKGEVRGGKNAFAHGYSASQGIFVHDVSRRYRDIFGAFCPITFEIFDKRPGIEKDPEKRVYTVEIRAGTSSKRTVYRKSFNSTGVYTERVYISYGPGYYTLTALLTTSHGIVYEDAFHISYNVHFMDGFGLLLWLPLTVASVGMLVFGRKKLHWDEEDFDGNDREGRGLGILGRALPS